MTPEQKTETAIKRRMLEGIADCLVVGQTYIIRIDKVESKDGILGDVSTYELKLERFSRTPGDDRECTRAEAYAVKRMCEEIDRSARTMSTKDAPHMYYKAVGTKRAKDIIRSGAKEG